MEDFRTALQKRTLLVDGAMGTMLQAAGLEIGACPELMNVDHPEVVTGIHRAYLEAGARILTTNSFGGNSEKLGAFGLGKRTAELNRAAVECALTAADGRAWVAGDMGPTGRFVQPVGDMDFDEATGLFARQAEALAGAGAHLLILETFTDIKELRAAVIGARDATDLPIVVTMTFEPSGMSLLGSSPEAAAVTLEALRVDAVGSNCGLGPDGILEVLTRMASTTSLVLAAQPNAGMPRLEGGVTVFPATPEEMASYVPRFQEIGAGIVGGCCGTTPEHIRALAGALTQAPPASRVLTDPSATRLSSRSRALFVGGNSPLRTIGERLNPTGRKALGSALAQGDLDPYRSEAARQQEAGAEALDVNVGVPGIDEPAVMAAAVDAVSQAAAVPLVIDSPRPEVVEAGLKAADGKVLINSVTGEEESLATVLPLARRYGAAVLGLALDERGIPKTAGERLEIAGRIVERARQAGIPDNDVMIDCLVLSAGAEQDAVMETVRAVSLVREQLGLNTLLGVSNISFGLPAREYVNAAFLAMVASAGLSAAIVNPFHETSMGILAGSRVVLNQDRQARRYIDTYAGAGSDGPGAAEADLTPEKALAAAVIDGQPDQAGDLARQLLEGGAAPSQLGEDILIPAMSVVGERFASNEYFLPQVIMSARAMKAAFEPVREALKGANLPSRGRILIATVEGDVHDIGKNIVITLLENHGFEVTDLGKNVPAGEIVRAAGKTGAQAIGLSALMTTTMIKMKEAVQAIREAGLSTPVVVGGAAVTYDFAREIGADGYAGDATEAVDIFLDLVGGV